jgi:hypothetical protein
VALQATRFFRQNGHPLLTDATWIGPPDAGPRAALAVAADAGVIKALMNCCSQAGFEVGAIRCAEYPTLSLMPPGTALAQRRLAWRVLRREAAVAGLLSLVLLLSGGARFLRDRARVAAELDSLKRPLAALAVVRGDMARAARMLDSLETARATRFSLVTAVAGLAEALPDSAYLVSVDLDASLYGRISGYARGPFEVLTRLERGGVLPEPVLEGALRPASRAGVGLEPFAIRFGRPGGP